MWKNIALLVPTLYLLKERFTKKEGVSPQIIPSETCQEDFIIVLYNNLINELINAIKSILLNDQTKVLLEYISSKDDTFDKSKLPTNKDFLKINIPTFEPWLKETNKKTQSELFETINKDITNNILNDLELKDPDHEINKIISILLKDIYKLSIHNYNNNVSHNICVNYDNKDNKKFCNEIITNLIKLYPQQNDIKSLLDTTSQKSVMEQSIVKAYNKFIKLKKFKITCSDLKFKPPPKLDDYIYKYLESKPVTNKNRLDKLSNYSNVHEQKYKLSDLTLKELITNTNTTILNLINIISSDNSYKQDGYQTNQGGYQTNQGGYQTKQGGIYGLTGYGYDYEKIKTFILTDNNMFYIGIFILFFTLILFILVQ